MFRMIHQAIMITPMEMIVAGWRRKRRSRLKRVGAASTMAYSNAVGIRKNRIGL